MVFVDTDGSGEWLDAELLAPRLGAVREKPREALPRHGENGGLILLHVCTQKRKKNYEFQKYDHDIFYVTSCCFYLSIRFLSCVANFINIRKRMANECLVYNQPKGICHRSDRRTMNFKAKMVQGFQQSMVIVYFYFSFCFLFYLFSSLFYLLFNSFLFCKIHNWHLN